MSSGDVPNWVNSVSRSLMESLNAVDPGTYQHCCRVGALARKLARDMGLNEYDQKIAEYAGMFHDIGKMGVDREIIQKPGKLDAKEMDIMRNHPVISEAILKPLIGIEFFAQLLPGVRGHHERVDGEGYPDKLVGERVPLMARVILIVDTYDAMSQTRAYRKGLPDEIIYGELKRCAGTQFDPQIVRIFLQAHRTWNSVENTEEVVEEVLTRRAS